MGVQPPGCSASSQKGLSNGLDDFIYQALPAGDYIRCLILEPDEEEDAPLFGRLELFDLSQVDGGFSFEAISYVWGSDVKDQTITINGSSMQITTSLSNSLRQTRQPDRPRALWADAICINQDDDEEKAHQVSLMGHIYKTSRCTLICLGYSTESWPQQVASLIADVEAKMDLILAGDDPELSIYEEGGFPSLHNDPLLADERWYSWAELEMQPWFERGWVVQEALLGPECLVLWGGVEIYWMSILRVSLLLNTQRHWIEALREGGRGKFPPVYWHRYERERPEEANALRGSVSEASFFPVLEALADARKLKLKDPRDRIYAFMALPISDPRAQMPTLHVSYGKETSHLDVYRDFAIKYVELNLDLEVLVYVEHKDEETLSTAPISCDTPLGQVGSAYHLPSWVPRWDRGPALPAGPRLISGLESREFHLDGQEGVTILDNSILRVKAVIFDSVEFVSRVIQKPEGNQYGPEALAPLVSLWRDVAQHSIYPSGPREHCLSSAEAFLFVLCLGQLLNSIESHHQWVVGVLKAFARLLEADWNQQDPSVDLHEKDKNAHLIAAHGLSYSIGRRFIMLGRGHYAISSVATRVGDVCAVISGTRLPFILRAVAGKKDHYELVEIAYVQSMVLTDDELPGRLGESESHEDWKELNLATRDIFLC